MTDMMIYRAVSPTEIRACYSVVRQLRPHFVDVDLFIAQVQRQMESGYHLAFTMESDVVTAVTGFRFLEFLAWGKVLYIDDLVTNSETRRLGHGQRLLKWVIEQAREAECDQVHLDSGPQRFEAHRLYLNQGFRIIGHHFTLDFKT